MAAITTTPCRVVLAFDTKVWGDGDDESLALNVNDVKNGVSFALAHRSDELGEFLDHTWIDGWLREVARVVICGMKRAIRRAGASAARPAMCCRNRWRQHCR
ncbi:virulence factor SrfB [Erwinia sp. MYb535]|uniref:virulence factor SrfB n=1 Tax=Erwinia sp. MYb535 TaxID=2745309 RepID=UPI00403F757F